MHAIELCGGMGLRPARVIFEAVGGRVRIGVCTFGLEAVTGAAAFKVRSNTVSPWSVPSSTSRMAPTRGRSGGQRTRPRADPLFVPVPDQSAAAAVATTVVDDDGVEIIELYRGIGPAATADVIHAVGHRVPIGSVLYQERTPARAAAVPRCSRDQSKPRVRSW